MQLKKAQMGDLSLYLIIISIVSIACIIIITIVTNTIYESDKNIEYPILELNSSRCGDALRTTLRYDVVNDINFSGKLKIFYDIDKEYYIDVLSKNKKKYITCDEKFKFILEYENKTIIMPKYVVVTDHHSQLNSYTRELKASWYYPYYKFLFIDEKGYFYLTTEDSHDFLLIYI